jgi:phage-related protein
MILNSGATNIYGISPFAIGATYEKNDVVYFSGYSVGATQTTCTEAQSGHYYYSGNINQVASASNTPISTTSNWTQDFYFEPSYGASVDYNTSYYGIKYGDGYFNFLNRSENALKATFNVSFEKRTDKETKALLHFLDDSFNKGERPSGGYTGIKWTPFTPYDLEARFFVENFDHQYDSPDVNSVSTTFFNETKSLTDWQSFAIPWSGTRQGYNPTGEAYYKHDAVFFESTNAGDSLEMTPLQSGWYYFSGDAPTTGISSDSYNSPTGAGTLWTKDRFYFDIEAGLNIEQNPRFTKPQLQNEFYIRMKDGLNKNLLTFSLQLTGRTDTEAKAIIHFLEHHRGSDLIRFTLPAPYNFPDKVFICQRWNHSLKFKDNNDITVEFLEFPIDYLAAEPEFNTLITVVNRPVLGSNAAASTQQRPENTAFVSNTGLSTYVVTGFSVRTGFYLTNSGRYPLETRIERNDAFKAFEFPSGISEPIPIPPGKNAFIPFYFNGMLDNLSGPIAGTGPFSNGIYTTSLSITSISERDGVADVSGPITLDITGYVTGLGTGNAYRGIVDDNPGNPEKFLIKTGIYDTSSGYPRNFLTWRVPESGYYTTRYSIQNSEDNSNWTGVDYSNVNYRYITDSYEGATVETYLYTGAMVPPSLIMDAGNGAPLNDPLNTGVRQSSTYMHTGFLGFNKNYYYRMRAELQGVAGGAGYNSMWVYASGTNDLNQIVSEDVETGLAVGSTTYTQDRIKIPTGPKQPLVIYLDNGETNINLSGKFDAALVKRNMVEQVGGVDTTSPATGIYAENFTGVQYVLRGGHLVGAATTTQDMSVTLSSTLADAASTMSVDPVPTLLENGDIVYFGEDTFTLSADASAGDISIAGTAVVVSTLAAGTIGTCNTNLGAIENGYQLLTGISPTHTTKPIAETPTILIMKEGSAIVGKGGDGGNAGFTYVTTTKANDVDVNRPEMRYIIGKFIDPSEGERGGDAVRITHKDIAKFEIQKDYSAQILGGGGGGGAGDRLNTEQTLKVKADAGLGVFEGTAPTSRTGSSSNNFYNTVKQGLNAGDEAERSQLAEIAAGTLTFNPFLGKADIWRPVPGASKLSYMLADDLYGLHYGGAGGGGQGFSNSIVIPPILSKGGKRVTLGGELSVNTTISTEPLDTQNGTLKVFGVGQGVRSPMKQTYGGDGAIFGSVGETGQQDGGGDPFQLDQGNQTGRLGGVPGKAIRVLDYSGTAHYTPTNFRDKMLFIGPRFFNPSNIEGLVAQFDAQDTSNILNVSAGAIANNTGIGKWKSKNDPTNVYLEQTSAGSTPVFFEAGGANQPSATASNPSPLNDTYFNSKNYVYFYPTAANAADYFELVGATANDITVDENATTGATSLKVASLGVGLASGTVIYFEKGSETSTSSKFVLSSSASASVSQVTLIGKLYTSGAAATTTISKGAKGWTKLSSLMDGFEIFYMLYADKWDKVTNTNNTTGLVFAGGKGHLTPTYKTGFTRFSNLDSRHMSQYYGRRTDLVQETMGLKGTDQFQLRDWPLSDNPDKLPVYRAWSYNLRATRTQESLIYRARNEGNPMGQESFAGNTFNFISTPVIGASQIDANLQVGFHGAIAEILIYSRTLTESERVCVTGYLMDKYLQIKTTELGTRADLIPSKINIYRKDANGFAGPVYFK